LAFDRTRRLAHSRVERSGFSDEGIVMAVREAAEAAVGELNAVLERLLAGDYS
jgi:hypothetical protein